MDLHHTEYLFGNIDPQGVAALYACGRCNSETSTRTDEAGIVHLAVHHDDGCPVLTGVLSSTPDVMRALVGYVPDTFRPGP